MSVTFAFDSGLAGASDEMLAEAVTHSVIHPLLLTLAATLDDPSLVPDSLRPDYSNPFDPNGGLVGEQLAEAHRLAVGALARIRDEGRGGPGVAPTALPIDELESLLEFVSDGADVDGYLDLLREELALGEDLRTPTWTKQDIAPDRPFTVAVIGAGMSGILAAHRLQQAGVEVVVIEKNADVGGTWLENSYPGCRVDVNNHFYSYSFAQRHDWPENYSSQPVLLDYFRKVADETGVRALIRFDTEVTAIELDESTMRWTLQLSSADGEDSVIADAVVSGVGQLNRPNLPDIPGLERFEGPAFHSARWDHDVDLTGKRVAVIGTGASAAQLIPPVAEQAGHLDIFQRTPAWFIPTPDYHDPVAPAALWLFRNVPGYANWFRFWIFWKNVEGLLPVARVDPEWTSDDTTSISGENDFVRQMLAGYITGQLMDRPDLAAHVVPDYPPFAKRFIRDNGIWAETLKRDDVDLVTDGIAEITAEGVRTRDGELHPADVIVYGTGFQASDFLMPMKVVGLGGVELHERWGGDARAYAGITLPDFPNLFLLYGPNTNIVANGSITYFSECEVHYLVDCIKVLLDRGARALHPTQAAHDDYNAKVDAENLRMAWGASSVNSWYKNATGRSAQNWPFTLLEYWQLTRTVDLDHYEIL